MMVDVEVVVRFSVDVKDQAAADRLAEKTTDAEWVASLTKHLNQGADCEVEVGEAYGEDE